MSKLWGGRFAKSTDVMVEEFTSSISFDKRMYAEDIAGSIAHAMIMHVTQGTPVADDTKAWL